MDSALLDIGLRIFLGGIIGFSIGLTGVGGGVLVMPALTVVLGFLPTTAIGTANAFGSLSKVYAIYEHWRLGNIDWRVGGRILVGAVPVAAMTALFIASQSASAAFQQQLGWLVTAAIGVSAVLMLVRVFKQRRQQAESDVVDGPEKPLMLALVLGGLIGALIASTSVGGGVIVMPILVFAFPMAMRRVVGTAIYIGLVVNIIASSLLHFSSDVSHVDLSTAGWMFAGSLLGIRSGSRLTGKLSDKTLTVVAVAMILLAVVAMTAKMLSS